MSLKNKNFAFSTLGGSVAIGATSLSVASGTASRFPSSGSFRCVIWGAAYASPLDDPNREIVTLTFSSGDVFTCAKAAEGTTDRAWALGDNIAHVITAGKLDEIDDMLNALDQRDAVRMTVRRAVLDSNGRNNAISAGTGLACNLAASSVPFIVTVPAGFSDTTGHAIDYRKVESADITGAWGSLSASTTCYLYYKRSSDGVWSRGFTALAPAFGWGTAERPAAPSNGQLYYDISKAKWDLYTTSWAEQTDTYVFCGEAATGTSSVTSVINYAINGEYDSGSFAVSVGNNYTKSVNMGAPFLFKILVNGIDNLAHFWQYSPYTSYTYGTIPSAKTFNSVTLNLVGCTHIGSGQGASGTYRIIAKRRF